MLIRSTAVAAIIVLVGITDSAAAQDRPDQVYWGDTHNHTSNSFDVYLFGTPNSTPDMALRFAKGERVINPTTGTP